MGHCTPSLSTYPIQDTAQSCVCVRMIDPARGKELSQQTVPANQRRQNCYAELASGNACLSGPHRLAGTQQQTGRLIMAKYWMYHVRQSSRANHGRRSSSDALQSTAKHCKAHC